MFWQEKSNSSHTER